MQTTKFQELFKKALREAEELVSMRNYRNAHTPIEKMFPHKTQDLTFMLTMKVSRILGAETLPEPERTKMVREEAIDILNYAAFLVALIDLDQQPTT